MKKLPLLLSTVSLIGVIILFILHFSTPQEVESEEDLVVAELDSLAEQRLGFPVAYVELDSILKNYEFVKQMQSELQAQYGSSEARFQGKMKSFQNKAQVYQKDLAMFLKMQQSGSMNEQEIMTQQQAFQARQQQILQEEQKIAQLQQKLQQQLSENQVRLNNEMAENIQGFLKKYSSELDYSYVLMKGPGSSVWFGTDSLNITSKLIDVLNAEYNAAQVNEESDKSE